MAMLYLRLFQGSLLLTLCSMPALVSAQQGACYLIVNNMERLACYDRTAPQPLPSPASTPVSTPASTPVLGVDALATQEGAAAGGTPAERRIKDPQSTYLPTENDRERQESSTLSKNWELDTASKRGVFVVRPYKTVYIMPFSYTDNINKAPSSSAVGRSSGVQDGLSPVEAKFQLSLKTKVLENLFGDNGDLWLGYTQSSRWQAYNSAHSSPFRESNYEPEAMLVFRTNYDVLGFKGSMAGIGVNHQSNGRDQPLSRSWNRVIAQAGFERDDWSVMLRPWWRMPENGTADDNPGIENYIGRGEMVVARKWQNQVFSVQARHSLRGGENSRGSALVAWLFPIAGDLKGYTQIFTGYGESLIDFNVKQTAIGLGFSMVDGY